MPSLSAECRNDRVPGGCRAAGAPGGFFGGFFPTFGEPFRDPFAIDLKVRLLEMQGRQAAARSAVTRPPAPVQWDTAFSRLPNGALNVALSARIDMAGVLFAGFPSPLDHYSRLEQCYRDAAVAGWQFLTKQNPGFVPPGTFWDCLEKLAAGVINLTPVNGCIEFSDGFARCLGLSGWIYISVRKVVADVCARCFGFPI